MPKSKMELEDLQDHPFRRPVLQVPGAGGGVSGSYRCFNCLVGKDQLRVLCSWMSARACAQGLGAVLLAPLEDVMVGDAWREWFLHSAEWFGGILRLLPKSNAVTAKYA